MSERAGESVANDPRTPGRLRRLWTLFARVPWQFFGAIGVVCLLLVVQLHPATAPMIELAAREAGYLGLFVASTISGFNLVVPVPVVALFPSLVESGMVPALAVVIIVVGMTTGDLLGALLGRLGRQATEPPRGRMAQWLETMMRDRPNRALLAIALYAAFVPAPNEIVVIPAAYFGMPIYRLVFALLLGNLVFNSIAASSLLAFTG